MQLSQERRHLKNCYAYLCKFFLRFLFILEIFKFSTHKLSDAASDAILKYIKEILPPDNKCPKTKYRLQSEANQGAAAKLYKIHSVCVNCESIFYENCCLNPLEAKISIFDVKNQCEAKIKGYYYYIIIFRILFKKFSFIILTLDFGKIMKEHARRQRVETTISDILSSPNYKNQIGFDDNILALTITFFADGGQMAKSTNLQMWPLLGTISELPPTLRYAQHNAIWFAVWYVLLNICMKRSCFNFY